MNLVARQIYGNKLGSIDVDAQAYITASGNSAFATQINNFFVSLKSAGLYYKIYAIYPFLGTTETQHKWNAVNSLDTDAAFRLTFNGGGTYSNNGYQTNGSNAYANSHLNPDSVQIVNSNGITVTIGTNNATAKSDTVEIGAFNDVTKAALIQVKKNNSTYDRGTRMNGSVITSSGVNEARGIWVSTKQTAIMTKFYRNNTLIGSGASGGLLSNSLVFIGNMSFGAGIYSNGYSNQRIQTTMIHQGFSDAEVATLTTIIDTFENALGRKTW